MTTVRLDPPARVVVGVDGSSESERALRWAAGIAATLDARLDAVIAWQFPVGYGWGGAVLEWNPGLDAEKTLAETIDRVFGSDRPADMRLAVDQGSAPEVLLRESRGAAMVVVGSRGRGGFAGLLMGSVSAKVAEHAKCPVLVVHGDEVPRFAGPARQDT